MFDTDTIIFVDRDLPHEIIKSLTPDHRPIECIVSSDGIICEILKGHKTRLEKLMSIHTALQEIRKVRAGAESADAERIVIEGKEL